MTDLAAHSRVVTSPKQTLIDLGYKVRKLLVTRKMPVPPRIFRDPAIRGPGGIRKPIADAGGWPGSDERTKARLIESEFR